MRSEHIKIEGFKYRPFRYWFTSLPSFQKQITAKGIIGNSRSWKVIANIIVLDRTKYWSHKIRLEKPNVNNYLANEIQEASLVYF